MGFFTLVSVMNKQSDRGQKEQSNKTIYPDTRVTRLRHLFVRQQERKGGGGEKNQKVPLITLIRQLSPN